jgi:predicted metal-dependent enzyme (double-stranded beta helix superfamily)
LLEATQELISVRDCGRGIAEAYDELRDDFATFTEVITPLCRRLLERPDLLTLGFPLGTHRTSLRLLYGDGELSTIIALEPLNYTVPVHDHSMWELLGLYSGRLEHTLYEHVRHDLPPGHAELKEIDRRIMEPGDIVMVPEAPNDVHGFTALEEHSYLVAILPGWYARTRKYFDFKRKTYSFREFTPV